MLKKGYLNKGGLPEYLVLLPESSNLKNPSKNKLNLTSRCITINRL